MKSGAARAATPQVDSPYDPMPPGTTEVGDVQLPTGNGIAAGNDDGNAFHVDSSAGLIGQVKWFDVKKGFGFIVGPEGQDVFVHFSAIQTGGFRTLKDGETVRYELHSGDKGMHASNVRRASPPPVEAE